jgi:hypothetical protein
LLRYEIQILLRLHILTLPRLSTSESASPAKRTKKKRAQHESTEEGLLHLIDGLKDLLEFDPAVPKASTEDEKPRTELFYDKVVVPL